MKIVTTLEEVCNDWDLFCKEQGWSEWAVNEGGGDIQVTLTEEEAFKYGVLRNEQH